jgi:Na+-translocating ferredoxin:NAD+ oxidoreductase RnfA subunit
MAGVKTFRVFLQKTSPLSCLYGIGLLIMASDRLAHAMTVAGALLWVYCLSTLAVHASAKIIPRQGKKMLFVFLATFILSFYLLLLWLLSPLCALSMFFVLSLVPIMCVASGILERLETKSLSEKMLESFSASLMLGLLLVIFALIREPFGYLSLSFPGGAQGIILLFSMEMESFLPVQLIATSSGALLLLGYFYGLYRYYNAKSQREEQ